MQLILNADDLRPLILAIVQQVVAEIGSGTSNRLLTEPEAAATMPCRGAHAPRRAAARRARMLPCGPIRALHRASAQDLARKRQEDRSSNL